MGKARKLLTALLFLAPNIAGFLAFTLIPVVAALFLSFCRWDMLSAPRFVGFANYTAIFRDHMFWRALLNTFYFAVVSIPLTVLGSMGLAVLLNRKLKGTRFFRTVFFLPSVCSVIAISLLWQWLYNTEIGLINKAIVTVANLIIGLWNAVGGLVGAGGTAMMTTGPDWLGNPYLAMPSVILMCVWCNLGHNMLIYTAGLQSIPDSVYEAAEIDGASRWVQFWKITVPMLSPTTFFVTIMSIIGSFQVFGQIFIMTKGGPAGATTTIVYYIYNNAFQWFKMGYACALAIVLFFIIVAVSLVHRHFSEEGTV